MRVSTKAVYGFVFMVHLSLHFQEGMVQLKEVAEKSGISVKYLEHIAALLKTSGLIKTERGVKGGYYLAKKPKEITAREIMEVLEGDLNLIERREDRPALGTKQKLNEKESMAAFWQDFSGHIKGYLESVTLEELTQIYTRNNKNLMYYI